MADASSSVRSALSSLRSPPETNARSPAPVMTSAPAPSAPSSAFSSWSIVSSEMALRACGRSMVMIARPSSNSRSTIKRSPSAVLAFSLSENSIAFESGGAPLTLREVDAKHPRRADETLRATRGGGRRTPSAISSRADCRPAPTPASWCIRRCGPSPAPSVTSSSRRAGSPPGCARAASVPATWSPCNCRTGWRPPRRSGRRRSSARSTVPIVHFYGRKELGHILGTAKPRVFITAEEFGRMEFQPDLCADIPIVGLVGRRRATRARSTASTICSPPNRWPAPSPPTRPARR